MTIGKSFWITSSLVFGFLLSQGNWAGAVIILGILLYFALLTTGLHSIALLLLVGPATFFVFINRYLDAIPFVTMERLIVFSMLGLILLSNCFKKESRVKLVPAEVAIICFLSYTFLSLLSTLGDKPISVWVSRNLGLYIQGYFMPMASFMIARRMIWDEVNTENLLRILTAVGVFLGFTAILQLFFGVSIFIPDYMDLIHHSKNRAVGTFANASEYGLIMSAFILIGALIYARTKDSMLRGIVLCCMALMFIGLVLSKTRVPWLGTIISLAFIFLHDKRIRPPVIALAGLGLLVSVIALPFLVDFESFSSRVMEISPILNRLAVWGAGLSMMFQNPLFGIGFGKDSFRDSLHDHTFNLGPVSSHWAANVSLPHNEFLFIAAHTGIVGILLYFSIFWHLFNILKNAYKSPSSTQLQKEIALCVGGVFICFSVNCLFVDIGLFYYFSILMYFLFGIVSTSISKRKDPQLIQPSPQIVKMAM